VNAGFCEKKEVTCVPPGIPVVRVLQVGNPWGRDVYILKSLGKSSSL